MKDASSTAIYGSRGANGVILITTKSGAGLATNREVSLNYNFTISKPVRKIRVLNGQEYARYRNESYANTETCNGNAYKPEDLPFPGMVVEQLLLDWNRPLEEGKPIDIACSDPAFVEEEWDWHGSGDGRFSIRAEWDGHSFSVTVTTSDDALVRSNGWESPQDMVSIFLATDSVQCARYDFAPGRPMRGDFAALRADGCCTAEGNSLSARLSVPAGCAGMGRIQLNVAFTDSDDARNVKPSVLWWKPEWGGKADFAGSGMFFLRPDHRLHRSSSALGGMP